VEEEERKKLSFTVPGSRSKGKSSSSKEQGARGGLRPQFTSLNRLSPRPSAAASCCLLHKQQPNYIYIYTHTTAIIIIISKKCACGAYFCFSCVCVLFTRSTQLIDAFCFLSQLKFERGFLFCFWQITRHSFVYGIEEYRHCVPVCVCVCFISRNRRPKRTKSQRKKKKKT
jgi:hypothetical protein